MHSYRSVRLKIKSLKVGGVTKYYLTCKNYAKSTSSPFQKSGEGKRDRSPSLPKFYVPGWTLCAKFNNEAIGVAAPRFASKGTQNIYFCCSQFIICIMMSKHRQWCKIRHHAQTKWTLRIFLSFFLSFVNLRITCLGNA